MSQFPPSSPFAADAVNPYAAPTTAPLAYPNTGGASETIPGGVWRQKDLLVMHKQAHLPAICVKSNQPAAQWLQRKLAWHEPWISVTILAGVLIYVILAAILTKRATIHVGLTDEWIARRKGRMITCWIVGLFFVAIIPGAFALAAMTDQGGWLLLTLVGFIGGLVTLVAGQSLVAIVTPQRITNDYIWLKGVNHEFLDRLPDFPYRV